MVSIITMTANALGGLFVGALKAFFSLISWFLKHFFNGLKLFFCMLPVTATAFAALFIINIVLLLTGTFSISSSEYLPQEGVEEANRLLENGSFNTSKIFTELFSWWNETVYIYHGNVAYIFLMILTVLMFLPVVSVLLCISVFASFGMVLFLAACIDAGIYVVRAVLGKSLVQQVQNRYFMLFREAGKKHDEKTYEKWLRRHHDAFANDEYDPYPQKSRRDAFYEDDEEEYYEDDYYEDDEYEDELEDGYEDEEFLEDNEYDAYEDNYDYRQKSQSPPPVKSSTAFDFFAGCNSRESLDRKYKSLVKLYHPDNMDGDTSALQEINVQYDKAKKSGRFD
ncbi:hypothetical protein [Butyrivibrio sp. MC2021]|uniref:hypothetical protein n=1 Tax=Butyrivibrio sp. MC2021 TaxID=1408306 RepID=UPI00047CD958|nr:hypothetical protein [Butyrivibrio sp. MC2021]